jgi:alkylation response protein AidB-like acyl-CoA dehydrogenase
MTALAPSAATLLQSVRDLRPLIEGESAQIERDRRITPRVVAALREAGVYRMIVPRAYGGSELTLAEYAQVMEQLAMADASTAWTVGQNSGIGRVAGYLPPEGAREIFGDPDVTVSWGNGPGKAHRVAGGYVVTFNANHASGMHHAKWLGSQDCETFDAAGNLVLNKHGEKLRGTCFFPRDEAEVREVWQVSGLRGTGTDCYSVSEVFVPERRFALEDPQVPGTLYLFNTTNVFAVGFSSVALGLARATLDALIDVTATKSYRGIAGLIRDLRSVQGRIGVAEATLRSARALLHETIAAGWERVDTSGVLDMRTRIDLRMATTFAMQRAAEVVDMAYKQAGMDAIFETNAFERRFRDMHAMTQHIQARDDHFEKVGQYLTGLEPEPGWL